MSVCCSSTQGLQQTNGRGRVAEWAEFPLSADVTGVGRRLRDMRIQHRADAETSRPLTSSSHLAQGHLHRISRQVINLNIFLKLCYMYFLVVVIYRENIN